MAGSLSDYAENKVLGHVAGKTAFTMPTVYLALCTADPTDAGTGTTIVEPSGGDYARVALTGLWAAASGGSITNASDIVFVAATGAWGTITHWALVDALTSGNMLWHGTMTASKVVGDGDTVTIYAGDLVLTLA